MSCRMGPDSVFDIINDDARLVCRCHADDITTRASRRILPTGSSGYGYGWIIRCPGVDSTASQCNNNNKSPGLMLCRRLDKSWI